MSSYLLSIALDKAALHVTEDAPPLTGAGLESMVRRFVEVNAITERLSRRYDARVLRAMLEMPVLVGDRLADPEGARNWIAALEQVLERNVGSGDGVYRLGLLPAEEPGRWLLEIRRTHHGVESTQVLQKEFFESPEYRRISELATDLADLVGTGAFVMRGDKRRDVTNFQEAVDWLMAEARRGQSVQRYKGLGEMNPDQLWETTVNPETRRLMQVRIEDAVAADEIFTTLMGDHVEPRREFIERNALAATNLDV